MTQQNNNLRKLRTVVHKAALAAAKSCAPGFSEQLRTGKRQGLERRFVDELERQLKNYSNVDVCREARRRDIELPGTFEITKYQERIDLVAQLGKARIGIEAKVCELPRHDHQGRNNCLYEIGQILKDHWQLQSTKLNDAYCVVILHGDLIRKPKRRGIFRAFHNQMFVDFSTSMEFGELKREGHYRGRQLQIESCKQLKFDLPFCKKRPEDFCYFVRRGLAIIGLRAGPPQLRN